MSRFFGAIFVLSTFVLAVGCSSCGEDDPAPEACPGGCLPGQQCNETTGECEAAATDADLDATVSPDETDAGDVTGGEDLVEDIPADLADQQDSTTDTPDGGQDEDLPDTAADLTDQSDTPVGPPIAIGNENLTLVPEPPVSFSVDWTYPEDQTVHGFEVRINGAVEANYGSTNAHSHRSTGHLPGATVTVVVVAYNLDGADLVYSTPAVAEITLPVPSSIAVTPLVDLFLAAPGTDSAAQTEALTVFLQYDGAVGFSPRVNLYEAGEAVVDSPVPVTFEVDDIAMLLVATVVDGVVTARGAGVMQFEVAYSWGGDAAGEVSTTVNVEVVNPDTPDGTLVLVWHDETDSLSDLEVIINGDSRQCDSEAASCSYDLDPGRYVLEFQDPTNPFSLVPITSIAYVYSGEDTIVGFTATSSLSDTNCQTIVGDDGGTVTSDDGATLTIPAGAMRVSGSREVCLRRLLPSGAPWRGRTGFGPAMFPNAYAVEPDELVFGEGTVLSVPVSAELEGFLGTDLAIGSLASVMIVGSDWLPGPQFELKTDTDRLEADISTTGLYSSLMCPIFGENEGSCRVAYGSCVDDQSYELEVVLQDTCGEAAEAIVSPLEAVDASDGAISDVANVFARAFGVLPDEDGVCIAHPCNGAEPCSSNCRAEATLSGCGPRYSGSLEVRNGSGEWLSVHSLEIIVPTRTTCEQTFTGCAEGAGCWPDVPAASCESVCLRGY